MYRITRSIDIDFAHNVQGHDGPCLSIHGHTWKFEVVVEAEELDRQGFVVDFSRLKQCVLEPCHRLLDHGYAVSQKLCSPDFVAALRVVGRRMLETRVALHGTAEGTGHWLLRYDAAIPPETTLNGAYDADLGGIKLVVFPFPPTSERLARWLAEVATEAIADTRVRIRAARIYEVLHPVVSMAEYLPRGCG